MAERLNFDGPSPFPSQLYVWFAAAAALVVLGGCSEVAGLQEHEPYRGFPDSASVPCWNGANTVQCSDVQTSAPQDGNVLTAPPAYEISGAEVHDLVTGLSWYRTPGDPDSYENAKTYCDVLPGDYRLPTRIELASLLDFGNSPVRIDMKVFPDVQPTFYWTSSQYGSDANEYWSADFCATCMREYPLIFSYVGGSNGILCVKGEPFQAGPFEVAGVENRFLLDTRTGLMWMKKPLDTMKDWVGSLQTCQKAPDGAYDDFRMPNAKELATIVDNDKVDTDKASIRDLFEVDYNQALWSSTPSTPGKVFTLNATGGSIQEEDGTLNYMRTLCVRGPD